MEKTKQGRVKGCKFISRIKAQSIIDTVNKFTDNKIHIVEVMFQAFVNELNTDERQHLLALLRAEAYPVELYSEQENAISVPSLVVETK